MKNELGIKVDSHLVKGVIENPSVNKLMILVHGFTGDWKGPDNIFIKLSQKLQKMGFAVLRFSFRGTPPSEGDFRDMTMETETRDLKKIIKYAKSLGYNEIGLLGESMGGAVVLSVYDPSINILIFWWPCFDFEDTSFRELLTKESQELLEKQGYLTEDEFKIGKKFIGEIKDINIFDQVENIKCPTLFVHGGSDSEVSHKRSQKAYEMIDSPKVIHIINGADHCCRSNQPKVLRYTTGFLEKYFSD